MKTKSVARMSVDFLMTLALLILMGYQFWGEAPHEWVGTGMFVLFIVHHVLNRSWYKTLFKGKYTAQRIIMLLINFLLLFSMAAQIYSAIVMSRYVFSFLPALSGIALARRLHILGAYWGFLFMGLHLGLHWNMILGMFHKSGGSRSQSKAKSIIAFLIGLAVAGYGIWVLIRRDLFTYLLLQTEFVFLDYSESKLWYYLDYLALMGLCIFLANYSIKSIRYFKNYSKKKQ